MRLGVRVLGDQAQVYDLATGEPVDGVFDVRCEFDSAGGYVRMSFRLLPVELAADDEPDDEPGPAPARRQAL